MHYTKISKLPTATAFLDYCQEVNAEIPFEADLLSGTDSPLAAPLATSTQRIGNRFCILPMEGWDGTTDGRPTELVERRWENFGRSGAKLIWGGEAVAVRPDGRANPRQLMINDANLSDLQNLRNKLVAAHGQNFDRTDDLSIGLQLTHSGRFAKPYDNKTFVPRTAYRHPWLDRKFNVDSEQACLNDDELKQLIEDFVTAARLAHQAGFGWVDIKHCHGYLGHELLSGFDRVGEFGGNFHNRTRFLREIVSGIRAEAPGLQIGVRLSLFDFVPFAGADDGIGAPSFDPLQLAGNSINPKLGSSPSDLLDRSKEASRDLTAPSCSTSSNSRQHYPYAFGGDGSGLGIDLAEPILFLEMLESLNIELLCTTAGSPYYVPHIQRPAIFPPSDGYLPPEDPLCGVARQISTTAALKRRFPNMIVVGSGYSYLQEWLPNVAQAVIRNGLADSIGLGRMVLSYPELPADALAGKVMKRKQICRTFSDCTTAPRNGLVSGCYPLDPYYKKKPEYEQLREFKSGSRRD